MIGVMSYLVFFLTGALILAIAVLGLNLQWGNTGIFNGGVAAFFGAGAYGLIILGGPERAALPSPGTVPGARDAELRLLPRHHPAGPLLLVPELRVSMQVMPDGNERIELLLDEAPQGIRVGILDGGFHGPHSSATGPKPPDAPP